MSGKDKDSEIQDLRKQVSEFKQLEHIWQEGQKKYASLVEHLPSVVYRCAYDKDWTMEFISAPIAEITGYPPTDFLYNKVRSFWSIVYSEDREKVEHLVEKAVLSRAPFMMECRLECADGALKWVRGKARASFLDDGAVAYLEGVLFDMTDQKKAEAALKESEERFRSMADSAPVMLWMMNEEERFEFFNKPFLEFSGRPFEEIKETGWTFIHPDDVKPYSEVYQKAFKDKEKFLIEFRMKNVKGHYRWILCTGVPRYSAAGTFAGFIGSCVDIEERKQLEFLKDEFVGTVSHELRTPMTVVSEAVSQVSDGLLGKVTDEQRRFLEIAVKNIERLRLIVDSLLDVSKIEAKEATLKREEVNLVDLAEQVKEDFQEKVKSKGLEWITKYSDRFISVYAEKEKIMQVLVNLISNAFKFTDTGRIEVMLNDKDEEVECSVRDTGGGIAQEDLPKVFGKFQQFGRTNGPGIKGTGLGLAISKGIVELHGGKISVSSSPDEGTKFTFTIPKLNPRDVFTEYVREGIRVASGQSGSLSVVRIRLDSLIGTHQTLSRSKWIETLDVLKTRIKKAVGRKMDIVIDDEGLVMICLPLTIRQDALVVSGDVREICLRYLRELGSDDFTGVKASVFTFPDEIDTPKKFIQKIFLDREV